MPGSLLQLVAIGSEDIFITGNPQITFFRSIYKRYSNFSQQHIDILFQGNDKLSYNNPSKLYIELPKYGHLISDISLELELPDIFSDYNKFRWIKDIGTSIINSVKIFIDGILIEELDGDFIKYFYNTTISDIKKDVFNDMTGNINELSNPYRNDENMYPKYEKDREYTNNGKTWYNRYYNTIPSIEGRKLIIPLCFWFSRHKSMQIPIISLENKIKMEFELKSIKELYVIGIKNTLTINNPINSDDTNIILNGDNATINEHSTNKNGEILYTNNTVCKYTYIKPTEISHEIKNFTLLPENEWQLNPILNVGYIFLDTNEKKLIENYEHRIVIDKILKKDIIGLKGHNVINVELFHPTKEILFAIQRDDVRDFNEHSNFTNFDETLLVNKYKNFQNYFYNICYNQYKAIKIKHDQISQQYNKIINSDFPISVGNKSDYKPQSLSINPISLLGKFRTDGSQNVKINNLDSEFNFQLKKIDGTNYPTINLVNNEWIVGDDEPTISTLNNIFIIEASEALRTKDIYNFINIWEYRTEIEIPSINYNNYKFFDEAVLYNLGILFNGDIRLSNRDYDYFNKIQYLNHHTNKSDNGIMIYSFAIDPEIYQPTGSCNFTALDKVEFDIDLKEPEIFENINKNRYRYNIKMYTVTYNILQISNKTARLIYNLS